VSGAGEDRGPRSRSSLEAGDRRKEVS
jgi:hypothetical protein